jgi:hypothetical protein
MSALTVLFLRRLAVLMLVLAILLFVVPRALVEVGLIGPGVQGEIEAAERAVAAAASYGAQPSDPPMAAALAELERARQLAAHDHPHRARRAAVAAAARAVEAQRFALVSREESRRRAQTIVRDTEGLVDELEDLFSRVTPGLERPAVSQLRSRMKEAREAAAGLALAYEQGEYRQVAEGEVAAKTVLLATRDSLRAAGAR